ncbi:MAG: transporter substrate-binding domain-containing protein [Alphaproteobacteria bacterium]
MFNNGGFAIVAFAASLAALGLTLYWSPPPVPAQSQTPRERSALARVKETKVLRCGYWLWPHLIEKNPMTGAISGPAADLIKKTAEDLGARVEWTAEATSGNYVHLLASDKIDAVCGAMVASPSLRPHADFTIPVFYVGMDMYVRAADNRFDASRETADKPEVKFLSLEGWSASYLAGIHFPHAQQSALPETSAAGQVMLDVAAGKADATIADQLTAERFIDTHPGSLKRVRHEKPLTVTGGSLFAVKTGEDAWLNTLNGMMRDYLDMAMVEKIMAEHNLAAGRHYQPVAAAYRP